MINNVTKDNDYKNVKDYLIVLDFDGVIWNSVDECFYVGSNAFSRIEDGLYKGDSVHKENSRTIQEQFRRGRYLVRTGDDFYLILKLLNENPSIDFEAYAFEDFLKLRKTYADKMKEFAQAFYEERRRMQKEERELWLSLQKPYPKIVKQLSQIQETFLGAAICSTKDKKSIELLLSPYNFNGEIVGIEYSRLKNLQVGHLMQKYNISASKIIFIDDIIENLLQVQQTGAICAMASWGYNNLRERRSAASCGFNLLQEDNLTEQLMAIIRKEKTHALKK